MCNLCKRAARRRNPNKYFGYSAGRHLEFFGYMYNWKRKMWPVNKFKIKHHFDVRKNSEWNNRGGIYRRGMRKDNGIPVWFD